MTESKDIMVIADSNLGGVGQPWLILSNHGTLWINPTISCEEAADRFIVALAARWPIFVDSIKAQAIEASKQ